MSNFRKLLKKNQKILDNFFSLILLNVVNYVFPIIIIPILITRLGVENYGIYILSFTILSYLNLIVQYGFNFSATSKIAKKQNDQKLLSETYTSVTVIRLFFSFIITLGLIFFGLISNKDITIYLFGIGIFWGQGLIPVWLFQGLEKMRYITIVNTFVRLITFVLIFVSIKTEKDVNYLMLIQSLSFFIGAFISILLVKYQLKINFVTPNLDLIKHDLKEGKTLFLSTIGMNLYRESNIVILGVMTGYVTVGLYAPAEKLIKGIQSFTNVIITALFPHFGNLLEKEKENGIKIFYKIGNLLSLLFISISSFMIFSASFIISKYIGPNNEQTILDFKILSIVILFGGLNYYYGVVGMINFNQASLFNKLVWISGLIGIFLSVILSFFMADIGAAIAMVIAEFVLLGLIVYSLKFRK
ncbi:oligosaccharide flippase family protein [Chishuiella changwenlii]|uniref:oligosaccharide flippase family protein n=1 Tax=Chishuiella changwenlii TaxID=1434701 RepID=UPI002FD99C10